jgi:hypothetical protein
MTAKAQKQLDQIDIHSSKLLGMSDGSRFIKHQGVNGTVHIPIWQQNPFQVPSYNKRQHGWEGSDNEGEANPQPSKPKRQKKGRKNSPHAGQRG